MSSTAKAPPAGTRALSADVIINESKCLISSLRTPTAFVSALPLNEFEQYQFSKFICMVRRCLFNWTHLN